MAAFQGELEKGEQRLCLVGPHSLAASSMRSPRAEQDQHGAAPDKYR